jgi:hypothetical protein
MQESETRLEGNYRFDGFAVDLINLLAQMLEFNYTLILQDENAHGSLNTDTGKWNGMLGELINNVRTDEKYYQRSDFNSQTFLEC